MLPQFAYIRPRTEREALEQLTSPEARIHAGGTDLLGCLRDRVFEADKIVSLGGLDGLEGVRESHDGGLRIGALTSIAAVAENASIRVKFPGLAQAAEAVASPQLRNQGTLGGNLCQRPRCWYFRGDFHCAKKGGDRCFALAGENRYHAIFGGDPCHIIHPSDTAPMLLALRASVRIVGPDGDRIVPLDDFFVLPEDDLYRENTLTRGELAGGPAQERGRHIVGEGLCALPSAGTEACRFTSFGYRPYSRILRHRVVRLMPRAVAASERRH